MLKFITRKKLVMDGSKKQQSRILNFEQCALCVEFTNWVFYGYTEYFAWVKRTILRFTYYVVVIHDCFVVVVVKTNCEYNIFIFWLLFYWVHAWVNYELIFLNYTVKVDYENRNLLPKTILWTLLELNNDINFFFR